MDWCFYSYEVGRRGCGGSGEFGPLSWSIVFISEEGGEGVPKMGVIYPFEAEIAAGMRIVQRIGAERVVPRGENGRDRGEV